jgi:hypothetical protein
MARNSKEMAFEKMNKRLVKSAAALNQTLQDMMRLVPEMIDDIIRNLLEQTYINLAGGGKPTTPIRTGRARRGWKVDTSVSDWKPPDMEDSPWSAEQVLAAARDALARLPRNEVYHLYNNVPYLLRLERGHSTQAPQGFIAITLSMLAREMDKRAKEFSQR